MTQNGNFTEGVFVKKNYSSYGDEIIEVSIKLENFEKNPITKAGYVNFQILKSRKGDYYAKNKTVLDKKVTKDNIPSEEFMPHVCYEGRRSKKYFE